MITSWEEYVLNTNEVLWGLVIARGIVAYYHLSCIEAFGGARRSKLDEQGFKLPNTVFISL